MRIFPVVALVCALATPAMAAPRAALDSASKPDLSKAGIAAAEQAFETLEGDARAKAVKQIEDYLSGISSIVAKFTQTSSDGSSGSGTFYMKRPGKVRWQYNPPAELLLVSNGKTLTYYDPGLKQVTYVGVDDTLASIVAQKTIQLDSKNTRLVRVEESKSGLLRATVIQRKKPDEGRMTLEFTKKPFAISRLITLDATGNETDVALLNPQYGPVLDEKLFVFEDPRGINDKRNRKK